MKKALAVIIAGLCHLAAAYVSGKEVSINENYKWPAPTDADMTFRLLGADRQSRTFYLKIKDCYVRVNTAESLSDAKLCVLAKSSPLVLYKKDADKTDAVFIPALSIDTAGMSDFIVGIFEAGGTLRYKTVDISLDAIPLGTATIINLQPYTLGLQTKDKIRRLGLYEKFTQNSVAHGKYVKSYIEAYSLQNPKNPSLMWPGEFSFKSGKRMILYIFDATGGGPFLAAGNSTGMLLSSDEGPRPTDFYNSEGTSRRNETILNLRPNAPSGATASSGGSTGSAPRWRTASQ